METYHKIQTLFKRHLDGPKKGKMIFGQWTTPALEYLADNEWEFTEKVDGTNIRVRLTLDKFGNLKVEFGGRTDNAVLPGPLMTALEDMFDNGTVEQWMSDNDLKDVLLFGEGYGHKIQNGGNYVAGELSLNKHLDETTENGTNVPVQKFVLFDVKIGDFWLERHNVDDIASKLGLDSVPVIGRGTLHQAIDIVRDGYTFNSQGAIVRFGRGRLDSKWGEFEAEGIVARTATPLFDRRGERMITKIKAVDFK